MSEVRDVDVEERLRKAVAVNAGDAEAWGMIAALCARRGALDEGIFALAAALRIRPRDARFWNNLAALQLESDRFAEAAEAARKAVEIDPAHAFAWMHLGRALGSQGDAVGAHRALAEALSRDPANGALQYWLAVALAHLGRWSESEALHRKAAQSLPRWPDAHLAHALALGKLARRVEAVEAFTRAAALDPALAPAIESQRLYAMQMGDEFAPDDVFAAHLEWARRYAPSAPLRARAPRSEGKVRIGYVSPRFQSSSMAFALEPVLEAHDRTRFDITCYAEVSTRDAVGERIRALADRWVETQDLADESLARRIEADGIDVLVDLAGHTPGNRLAAFARRPARAAVSWLDYFNTTGLQAIDALVADDGVLATPLGQRFVERVESVGPVRYVYRAPDYAGDVTAPRAQGVVFGSFARLAKVTAAGLDAWAAILKRVPDSRLLLKNDSFADPQTCVAIRAAFSRGGIGPARIELRAESGHEAMLGELLEVDVILDTFPYNGGITTLEALWMGRPVVSLSGDTLVSRQGASILGAVGLSDLAARDVPAYVDAACAIAADAPRRARLATSLRNALSVSPLGDAKAFTQRLESLYLRLLAGTNQEQEQQ